jgi:arabinofuranan 3-O-arabinosyltransferase
MAALLLAGAPPLLLGNLRTPGWTDVPQAWSQVAAYLADRPQSRALVVPGSGFGIQTWGWTIDEPIQGFADTPWLSRSQVPMVPGPTARVLDAVENRLANSQGSAGLAQFLARAGITDVVLRRDLDPSVAETAAADRVERALLDSPGLDRVAGFGRTGFGDQRLIDVFRVTAPSPRAAVVDARDVVTLDGGPEDVLAAVDADVLRPSDAVLVQSGSAPGDLVSDGYRLVERQFGRSHDAVSEVMTGSASYREARPAHDYAGAPTVRRAEAHYVAVDGVSASTSQGYADVFGPVLPAHGPAAAFDGRTDTSWRSAPLVPPTGQWLDVDLRRAISGGVLRVSFVDSPGTATVREAAVSFDGTRRVYSVPEGGALIVPVPATHVHRVRISVVSVQSGLTEASPVAIAEVELPGTAPGRTLDVPRPIGPDSTVLLTAEAPRRACVDVGYGPHCETSEIRTSEEDGLDRRLHVAEAGTWTLSGTVVAKPTAAAAALLGPLDGTAGVSSDSAFGGDPAVSAAFAFDGRSDTPWLVDPDETRATMTLTWKGDRTVRRIVVDPARVPATEPVRARIESSAGVRDVDLTGFGYFPPLEARDGLSITLFKPSSPAEPALPLGVGEVSVEGLDGLQHSPDLNSPTSEACGLGPEVRIDGGVHRTEVSGTLGDVVAGRPLTWRVCDGPVELTAGEHRVEARATVQFQPLALAWRPATSGTRAAEADSAERLRVVSWADDRRTVAVRGGTDSILRIAENVNSGWRATLDGRRLEPVVLDGWQQGYRIPAGAAGTVVVEFVPDHWYRMALLAGCGLAGALVLLTVLAVSRWRVGRSTDHVDLTSETRVVGMAGAVAAGIVGLVLGGVPFAAGWAVGLLRPAVRFAVPLGVGMLVLSGVLVATSAGTMIGRPSIWADAVAAFGFGLLLTQVVRLRRPRLARWRARRVQ